MWRTVFFCLLCGRLAIGYAGCAERLDAYARANHRLLAKPRSRFFERGGPVPIHVTRGTNWTGVGLAFGRWQGKTFNNQTAVPLRWCLGDGTSVGQLPVTASLTHDANSMLMSYDHLPITDEIRWLTEEQVLVGRMGLRISGAVAYPKALGYFFLVPDAEDDDPTPLSNFYGDIVFRPALRPSTVAELVRFVETTDDPITLVAGSRSFGAGLDGGHETTYVLLDKLRRYGIGDGTIWVEPGVTFGELTDPMIDAGWTFRSYPAVTPPTVIGALSTNSHGSGSTAIGNHVVEMTVLTATGELRRIDRTSDDWGAWLMSMGDLGIIVNATFRTEPLYVVSEHWGWIESPEAALNSLEDNDAFVVIQDRVMVQRVRRLRQDFNPRRSYSRELVRWPMDSFNTAFQHFGTRIVGDDLIKFELPGALLDAYIANVWHHTRHVGYPNVVLPGSNHNSHRHVESELFVERKDLLRTLRLLQAWKYDTPGFNNLYVMFVRRIPPDTEDIPLSPFRDVERFGIILFSYEPWTELHRFDDFLVMTGERLQQEGIHITYHRGKYAPKIPTGNWGFAPDTTERWRSVRTRLDPRNRFRNVFIDGMMDV